MMRSNYRHMMEGIALDDGARARILERLEGVRPRRVSRAFKAALIAACVCLALAGTVAATGKFLGVKLQSVAPEGFKVRSDVMAWWRQEDFGAQMAADVAAAHDGSAIPDPCFSTWAELEDYVGLPLAYNPLLEDGAEQFYIAGERPGNSERLLLEKGSQFSVRADGETPDGVPLYRYRLGLWSPGEGLIGAGNVWSFCEIDGVKIHARMEFRGSIPKVMTNPIVWGREFGESTQLRAESYTLRDGTPVQLIYDTGTETGRSSCYAFFIWEGNLYELDFYGIGESGGVVRKVLDAFE